MQPEMQTTESIQARTETEPLLQEISVELNSTGNFKNIEPSAGKELCSTIFKRREFARKDDDEKPYLAAVESGMRTADFKKFGNTGI